MNTPNANLLPTGYWVASDLADRLLICGDASQVWGDTIPQGDLYSIVEDFRAEEGLDDDEDDLGEPECHGHPYGVRHRAECFGIHDF